MNKKKLRDILSDKKCIADTVDDNPFVGIDLYDLCDIISNSEQQMIENACELYRKELVSLNNLLVAYNKEVFANLIMIDDSVVDFRNTLKKAIKEEQND